VSAGGLKTIACVGIAGALFIAATHYALKPLFIIAAFFDWLPVAAGWMKIRPSEIPPRARPAGMVHGVITAAAYAAGIAWLAITNAGPVNLGFAFLELWFAAVVAGMYVKKVESESVGA